MNKRLAAESLGKGAMAKRQRGLFTPGSSEDNDGRPLRSAIQGAEVVIAESYRIASGSRGHEFLADITQQQCSNASNISTYTAASSITMSPRRQERQSGGSSGDYEGDIGLSSAEVGALSDSFAKFQTQWDTSDEEEVTRADEETLSNTSEMSTSSSVQIILSKDVTMSRGSPKKKAEVEIVVNEIEDDDSSAEETVMDIVANEVELDDMPVFADSLGVEMFDIVVGPTAHLFRLHKARLVSMIPWFDCSAKGPLTLPYDTPQAFSLLVQWIYSGTIPEPADIDPYLDPVSHFVQRNILLDAYVLGGRVNSVEFMDYIVTIYIDTFVPNVAELSAFLDKIPRLAPLRHLGIMFINYALSHTENVTDYVSRSAIENMLAKNPCLAEECSGERAFQYVGVDPRRLPRSEFHGHTFS